MIRNYDKFDLYYRNILDEVYGQAPDAGHTAWSVKALDLVIPHKEEISTVLDIGCGQGFMRQYFERISLSATWTGIALGTDFQVMSLNKFPNIYEMDMSFLDFPDASFDLIYARHTLEHSPFPLITLKEWHRVSSKYLLVVAPAPEYWGYKGKNHYSVMQKEHLEWLFDLSGWKVDTYEVMELRDTLYQQYEHMDITDLNKHTPVEHRFLCHK